MVAGSRWLGIITARGGSKRLPGKNILPLAGKPMLAWTIEAAQKCTWIDRLVLSTDDAAIAAVAQDWGCEVPFMRPAHLATDMATSADVVMHALDVVGQGYTHVVLLQPTSPLRTADDITATASLLSHHVHTAISVTALDKPVEWLYTLQADGQVLPLMPHMATQHRMQDATSCYAPNGAVYALAINYFRAKKQFIDSHTHAHVMPKERSVDIDTGFDFQLAAQLLAASNHA